MYFGNGCFFAHQHLLVEFERSLGRADEELTAIQGYAGSVPDRMESSRGIVNLVLHLRARMAVELW